MPLTLAQKEVVTAFYEDVTTFQEKLTGALIELAMLELSDQDNQSLQEIAEEIQQQLASLNRYQQLLKNELTKPNLRLIT